MRCGIPRVGPEQTYVEIVIWVMRDANGPLAQRASAVSHRTCSRSVLDPVADEATHVQGNRCRTATATEAIIECHSSNKTRLIVLRQR
jgi:hypothetical protein